DSFKGLSTSDYTATKSLRKTTRIMNKHIKFMSDKVQELELSLFFCELFIDRKIVNSSHKPLIGLLFRQIKRIGKLIPKLEEDLQFDYQQELDLIMEKLKSARPYFHISEL